MSGPVSVFVFGDATAETLSAARACADELGSYTVLRGWPAPLVVDRAETTAPVLLLVATHRAVEPFVVVFARAGKTVARAVRPAVAVAMLRALTQL